jgi:putative ABC transport system permease protein
LLFGVAGGLAGRSLVDRASRVAITTAALVLTVANTMALATLIATLDRTLTLWFDSDFGRLDIGISSGTSSNPSEIVPMPESVVREVAELPEIEAVNAERWVKIPFEGSLTNLVARDAVTYTENLRRFVFVDGDPEEAVAAFVRGDGVVVSDVFAHRFGKQLGERISLRAPHGAVELPIAGINLDISDLGTIVVERSLYRRHWGDTTVSFVDPVLRPSADREQVMEEIRRRFGERYGVFVTSFEQIREEAEELLERTIAMGYPILVIAVVIALFGVMNSLLASVLDRVREIGLLRALGATRRQIVRSVVIESAIVGLAGAVAGVAAGSMLGVMVVRDLLTNIFGISGFYAYPAVATAFVLVITVALAATAGLVPGRRAGRIAITEALGWE